MRTSDASRRAASAAACPTICRTDRGSQLDLAGPEPGARSDASFRELARLHPRSRRLPWRRQSGGLLRGRASIGRVAAPRDAVAAAAGLCRPSGRRLTPCAASGGRTSRNRSTWELRLPSTIVDAQQFPTIGIAAEFPRSICDTHFLGGVGRRASTGPPLISCFISARGPRTTEKEDPATAATVRGRGHHEA